MKKINLLIYLVGFVLLGLSGKFWINSLSSKNQNYISEDEHFDLNLIINSNDFLFFDKIIEPDTNKITGLFILSSGACPPCINEIISYNRFFEDRRFNNYYIQQLVLVLDQDKKRVIRFIKTSELSIPVIYGYNEKIRSFLQTFGETNKSRQLIFINNRSHKVLLRVVLPKGESTTIAQKENVFKKLVSILLTK